MCTSQSVSLTQSTTRTLTKRYWIKLLGLRGHHMTPCDTYAKWLEPDYAAVLYAALMLDGARSEIWGLMNSLVTKPLIFSSKPYNRSACVQANKHIAGRRRKLFLCRNRIKTIIPLQDLPSGAKINPSLHEQWKLPSVFWHRCSQKWLPVLHSFMSG